MLICNYLQFKLETSANIALRGKDTSYQLDEYYTIDETANILKVSPQTIRNYIEGNLISAINFNTDEDKRGFVRIKKSDLIKFIESREKK